MEFVSFTSLCCLFLVLLSVVAMENLNERRGNGNANNTLTFLCKYKLY